MTSQPVALVTGATSGIGEATAHRLHDRGYLVYAVGRNPAALDALRSRGLRARSADITDEAAVDRLVGEIHAEQGRVDLLVNSAGLSLTLPLEQVGLADLRNLLETNVVAMLHLSQAVLPGMRSRQAGTIVNIGSTGGRWTSAGAGAYHISKYGVTALSLSMRGEVRPFGVRVVLIDPTVVRTRFVEAQLEQTHSYPADDPYGEFKRRYVATTAKMTRTRGMLTSVDAVARAVVRAAEARNPKPRYVVGASGHASVLARRFLSDRMWERVLTRGMSR